MDCPKCGTKNPDDVNVCSSCSSALPKAPDGTEKIVPKTSSLAVAAFVLGILSLFSCGLTILPAIILGVVGFVIIEKSGGRCTGRAFAILAIIIPILVFFAMLLLLLPSQNAKQMARRLTCGANLSRIGTAMIIYSNDYDDAFPHPGGKDSIWRGRIANWRAKNRFDAYELKSDGTGGSGNISSCFYLLVKYVEVTPKRFICKGDVGVTEFNPADYGAGDKDLTDFWDFGPQPSKHCSYSYHMPFGQYALTASSDPYMAVAADRNPLQDSPAAKAKQWPGIYNPDGGRKAVRYSNAIAHQEDGQNVLFLDFHVKFMTHPFCGVNDDNIYTSWDGGDIRIGVPPQVGVSEPQDKLDSLLVHDEP